MSSKPDYSYLHRAVGELAAKIRQEDEAEPARVRSLEQWKRTADGDARKQKSDTAAAFIAYARACGYSPESERVLLIVMTATGGEDRFACCPDWLMGAHLAGMDAAEVEELRPLPTKAREKRTLAQRWKRAWDEFDLEQKRAGFDSIKRQPGTMNLRTGKGRASEMYALFVQDLVEIEREAKQMRGVRRYERFDHAARTVVHRLKRERPRTLEIPPEPRRTRLKAPETTAMRLNRCVHQIQETVGELVKSELAAGATPDDVHMLAEALFNALGSAFAHAVPSVPLEDLKEYMGLQKSFSEDLCEDKSDAPFENEFCENTEEKQEFDPLEVFKFEDLSPTENSPFEQPAEPAPDPVELAEAEAIRWEACQKLENGNAVPDFPYDGSHERRAP